MEFLITRKALGQLFCDRSARDILGMLEAECQAVGVSVFLGTNIRDVARGTDFVVATSTSDFQAPALVVATGGLSIPKVGATSFGYHLATQFGLRIREPKPGLVPLLFNPEDLTRYRDLSGISTEVLASVPGQVFREKMLITHRGLSGPAILQISSYWNDSRDISLDLAPDLEIAAPFRDTKTPRDLRTLSAEMRKALPHRLADRWLELNAPTSWTNVALSAFEKRIHAWTLHPEGNEGFDKAEVTVGGVDTDELSAKTMETRKVSGTLLHR